MVRWARTAITGTSSKWGGATSPGQSVKPWRQSMSDAQFRTWANRLITTVAGYYILYGGWLLFTRGSAMAF
jgi:hypothetical protein